MMDQWDREAQTVLLEDMVEKAINIHKENPDKRLVIHFVPSHLPYVGEKAGEMGEQLGRPTGEYNPNQDPWFVSDSGSRRETVAEDPIENVDN